jgi:hypothetical protein
MRRSFSLPRKSRSNLGIPVPRSIHGQSASAWPEKVSRWRSLSGNVGARGLEPLKSPSPSTHSYAASRRVPGGEDRPIAFLDRERQAAR